jgi:hypothetical protein
MDVIYFDTKRIYAERSKKMDELTKTFNARMDSIINLAYDDGYKDGVLHVSRRTFEECRAERR